MLKRVFLFVLVNLGVMITLNVIINLLGIGPSFSRAGINYGNLMMFCLVWGMGGALISLMISKQMAKWTMGLRILDPRSLHMDEQRLVATVHRLSAGAGLTTMPEVAVYDSPEVNAFATGPSRSNSLVAVSTGLLNAMSSQEVDAVLGHEVSHIANGDMVTMTLLQGVLNAFVMFFAKVIAWVVASSMQKDNEESQPSFLVRFLVEMVLQIVFGLLASMIVAWFSRYREYRADQGGAQLAGRSSMINALMRLNALSSVEVSDPRAAELANFKISSKASGFLALLASHPPLEDRIQRLSQQQ